MNRPLFRTEALEARQGSWLGRVQLLRPLSLDLITLGVLVSLLLLAVFLTLAHYTRKATVDGALVPDLGLIRLVPTDAATVVERHATEGQVVRSGDVLFVLALERPRLPTEALADVRRSLSERQRSLLDAARHQESLTATQVAALDRRLQALDAELLQAEREAALQQQRLVLAQQAQRRLEALRDEQFISEAQVLAKKEELLGLQAQLQSLERQRAALQREKAELEGDRRSAPLLARNAQGSIERDLAALARETAEQDTERRLIVRAPQDGLISAVMAEPGQSVSPASALASLVPQGAALQAQLLAPSSAVGFVRPGQAVRLRLEAFPYQKYGPLQGRVLQVSRTPLAAGELAAQTLSGVAAGRPGEALFRITVALDAEPMARWPQPLVAGMRLQADVLLERRRLIEWMFEPLFGLQHRL
ncbi:HlyD family secretion protein [Pseudorhodoferax sp.]|uniref:HlyD family secretion protein n=1 Tax=Pseudorhodoferax sp. TaxID=1993553 RepID=UPI002DD6A508|nr:HlyD family efflux transporter periplasmic adaptor subunit [Pseudorhodoferax sp.]